MGKHILKRKQKYFKEKIDPNFQPTIGRKPQQPEQPEPTQPDNEPNPHDPTTKTQTKQPPNPSSSESTSSSSREQKEEKSNYSPPRSSSSYHPGYGGYGGYQPPPTKIGQILSPFLNYYYLASQWFVFLCCLLSVISSTFYYRALYGTIIMYLINTLQTNGKPQFNMYYAQRVMQDENIMIAIYAAIFLMGNPLIFFLTPIILRSLFMGTYLLSGLLGAKVPSLHSKLRPYFQMILTKRGWFNERIAILEVLVGIFLIFACFFMSKTVILTFIYWQIMHARYMMSRMIQYAFSVIHQKIQSMLSRIPFLLNGYLKLAAYLSNMVDPQRIQQQMQNPQGAASGISKYCQIM